MKDTTNELACSFCARRQREVEKLIAGPGVYICNECVALCGDIVVEDRAERAEEKRVAGMDDSFDKMLQEKAAEAKAEREPTVVDLVANLRARCDAADPDAARWTGARRQHEGVVTLDVTLVRAIADGIEASARPLDASAVQFREAGDVMAQAAKDIVKLIVTRLFEPAKAEGEKALEACRRLGVTDEQAKAPVAPTSALDKWMPTVLGAGTLGLLSWLTGSLGKRKGGLGA